MKLIGAHIVMRQPPRRGAECGAVCTWRYLEGGAEGARFSARQAAGQGLPPSAEVIQAAAEN